MNQASEKRGKAAKLKKCQQFKQIQKLKIAKKMFGNKRWKMKKNCQKHETKVEKRKNF